MIVRYEKGTQLVSAIRRDIDEFKRRLAGSEPTADQINQLHQLQDAFGKSVDQFGILLIQAEAEFLRPADDAASQKFLYNDRPCR